MPPASPEDVGRELSDLASGIIEQNWLEQHVAKAVDLKSWDEAQRNTAEWELTYLVLFAITKGCGAFAAADSARTTAVLKSFHVEFLKVIAEHAGADIAGEHQKNLVPRYKLYGQTIEGEDESSSSPTAFARLGQAAALQILGKAIDAPQDADMFRETIKVIFTEVREAAMKVMLHQQMIQEKTQ